MGPLVARDDDEPSPELGVISGGKLIGGFGIAGGLCPATLYVGNGWRANEAIEIDRPSAV